MIKILKIGIMLLLILFVGCSGLSKSQKIVIAHRGASGYLPEHSMAAKAMAYAMGANYIEQDVVMTKDNKLVVLHDHYLDTVTNVASKYPRRKRKDGRYYAIDFTLKEIKGLKMTERFKIKDGKEVAVYPSRFPIWKSDFRVHTLAEEIELIQGLNKSTGKKIGIYTEIKAPWFYRHEGKDISIAVLKVLKKYGYTHKSDLVYLQCFDPNELLRIKTKLFPKYRMDIKLIQLVADTSWNETMVYKHGKPVPYNYDWMLKKGGMKKISTYADGIGPWKPMLVSYKLRKNNLIISDIVKNAHKYGMKVHPYTFRLDKGTIPKYASNFDDLLDIFYNKVGVDGVFTDYTDRVVGFLKKNNEYTK